MRTKRSAPPNRAAPISTGVVGRARRATGDTDGDPEGDARAQLLRVVALLGIGLVAAAILLPSGEPAVVVPGDALQPASATAAADEPAEDAESDDHGPATSRRAGTSTFATGSSAASVVGDDLPEPTTPPTAAPTAAPPAARPESDRTAAKSKRVATKRKRRQTPKRSASRRAPAPAAAAPRQAPAPSAPVAPPPAAAAAPPAPKPAPRPAPRRARGGPTAEFGGL